MRHLLAARTRTLVLVGGLPLALACCGQTRSVVDPSAEGSSAATSVSPIAQETVIARGDADCKFGGKRVAVGFDANDDGALSASEVVREATLCNGADGAASLSTTTQIPPGEECANGGIRIESGLDIGATGDVAGDGVLGPSEVQSNTVLCNGADGKSGNDGSTALVRTVPEPSGEHCADAGYRVDTGLDSDRDGTLSDYETVSSSYACNGAQAVRAVSGSSQASRVVDVPRGAFCANGGRRLDIGADDGDGGETAGDGILEDGEVDSSEVLCNGLDGFDSVVSSLAIAPDATCARGGHILSAGRDDGRSGGVARDTALAIGETRESFKVCDGTIDATGMAAAPASTSAPGYAALVRVSTVASGAWGCATGGVLVETGTDDGAAGGTARDGALQDAEVITRQPVCNGARGKNGSVGTTLVDARGQVLGTVIYSDSYDVYFSTATGYVSQMRWAGRETGSEIYWSGEACSGTPYTWYAADRTTNFIVWSKRAGAFLTAKNASSDGTLVVDLQDNDCNGHTSGSYENGYDSACYATRDCGARFSQLTPMTTAAAGTVARDAVVLPMHLE